MGPWREAGEGRGKDIGPKRAVLRWSQARGWDEAKGLEQERSAVKRTAYEARGKGEVGGGDGGGKECHWKKTVG
jgi:hypothetical protein